MSDYKWQMQMRAEEIAQDRYEKDFYDLPESVQYEVFTEAMEGVTDGYVSRGDALRKASRES
jgi:hypothetical protein